MTTAATRFGQWNAGQYTRFSGASELANSAQSRTADEGFDRSQWPTWSWVPARPLLITSVAADVTALPIVWRAGNTVAGENFLRNSVATYLDNQAVIQSVAAWVKRDAAFIGIVGPGLLVEPERTNMARESQTLSDAGGNWHVANVTVTDNAATGPGGAATAERLQSTAPGNTHRSEWDTGTSVFAPGDVVTFSIYVKNNGGTRAVYSAYDWTHSADIVAQTSYFAQLSDTEWRLIQLSFTIPSGCTFFAFYTERDDGNGLDVFFDEGQSEVGAYASSRIRTTSEGAVTREQDVYQIPIASGTAATRYVKYVDLATSVLTESVSAITTAGALDFEQGRLWLRNAVQAGTWTLADMQFLYRVPSPLYVMQAVQHASSW